MQSWYREKSCDVIRIVTLCSYTESSNYLVLNKFNLLTLKMHSSSFKLQLQFRTGMAAHKRIDKVKGLANSALLCVQPAALHLVHSRLYRLEVEIEIACVYTVIDVFIKL